MSHRLSASVTYSWCSCGHGSRDWTRPDCRERRWWGRCSHTCRRIGTSFQWCCMISLFHRPSLWKRCSSLPGPPVPTPPSSFLLWVLPPRCSQGDMDLLERHCFFFFLSLCSLYNWIVLICISYAKSIQTEPTCDVLGRLWGVAGTSAVIGYHRDGVVLTALHRGDEAVGLSCWRTVLAICGHGYVVLSSLHRQPIHSHLKRPTLGHLDVDDVWAQRTWKFSQN